MLTQPDDTHPLPFSIPLHETDLIACTVDLYNERVKLQLPGQATEEDVVRFLSLAKEHHAGKAIVYATEASVGLFEKHGFRQEGSIPGFFNGRDALLTCFYFKSERRIPHDRDRADTFLSEVLKPRHKKDRDYSRFSFRRAHKEDSERLAHLYGEVFTRSYPTPIHKAQYIADTMTNHTTYQLCFDGEVLCGAASLEASPSLKNAEVTDCAVPEAYRGQGILNALIARLERDAAEFGLHSLYSLSRSMLPGINAVLASGCYDYFGRLVNNCRMCGQYEDMNIWQKFL